MTLLERAKKLAGHLLRPIHAGSDTLASSHEAPGLALEVTTSSFTPGGPIPPRYAANHHVSPALAWTGSPPQTQELVILVEDPDAPMPQAYVHWAVYGLPASVGSLPEGASTSASLPPGTFEGKNSTGSTGFFGPKPPPGHGVHHYHFQVFALDAPLGLGPDAERDAIVEAMEGHVLAKGEVIGTYEN